MTQGTWIKVWLLIGVGISLFGCATSEDARILDREVRRLQSQLAAVQKDQENLKKELATSQDNQRGTQKESSALRAETQKTQSDLLLRVENLQSEVRNLSTAFEEYKDYAKKPSKEIDRVREDTATRLRLLEEREKALETKNKAQEDRVKLLEDGIRALEGKIDRLASKQTDLEKSVAAAEVERAASARQPPAEVRGLSTGAGDLYRDAYDAFQKGDHEGARRKFEAFLKQYPNTDLSDNAQFWIGETYFLKKDYEKAILEYEKAITKYPEGDKVPSALFKQALAFLELGDKNNARTLLRRVIERYPHSEQADMARKRLETLK